MKTKLAAALCLLAGTAILGSGPARAYGAELEAKLLASDGQDHDSFGSVALDSGTIIVGAFAAGPNGYESGAAYVFTRSGEIWTEVAKLLPSDGESQDRFGQTVALDGDTVVVSAALDDDNGEQSGSAYVFVRAAAVWTEQAKLKPADGAAYDGFGWRRLAIDGDTALIGSSEDDNNGPGSGSSYAFTRTGTEWAEQAKLLPSESGYSAEDYFGYFNALDGDTAIVGAWGNDDNGEDSGSAYVFTRTAGVWTEQAKLLPADSSGEQRFGWSVAVDGDTALIGAYSDRGRSGSAYVFTRSGNVWTEQAKLVPPGAGEVFFGWDVAVQGNTAVVSAIWDGDVAYRAGAAYVFTRAEGVWSERTKLLASDGAEADIFGDGIAFDGDTVVIGARSHAREDGEETGAVYVFRLKPDCGDGDVDPESGEECDDGNNVSCDGCSQGCQIEIGLVCGDGTLNEACHEECDDGNNVNDDGCSATCEVEGGDTCGDGVLNMDSGEECDDGNNVSGDGCSSDCAIEMAVPATSPVGVILLLLALGGGGAYVVRRRG